MDSSKSGEFAHIGKSVVIKGELSGTEDLYVDGQVEGTIELQKNRLTIGPNGQVKARVNACGIIVEGNLEGNVTATESVELRKSAVTVGDMNTRRISIEDGAFFKGKIEMAGGKAEAAGAKAGEAASGQKSG
jgi:cytoskeletal protein CcmA (bactofilin family)